MNKLLNTGKGEDKINLVSSKRMDEHVATITDKSNMLKAVARVPTLWQRIKLLGQPMDTVAVLKSDFGEAGYNSMSGYPAHNFKLDNKGHWWYYGPSVSLGFPGS